MYTKFEDLQHNSQEGARTLSSALLSPDPY
jgi:hypothetical protein